MHVFSPGPYTVQVRWFSKWSLLHRITNLLSTSKVISPLPDVTSHVPTTCTLANEESERDFKNERAKCQTFPFPLFILSILRRRVYSLSENWSPGLTQYPWEHFSAYGFNSSRISAARSKSSQGLFIYGYDTTFISFLKAFSGFSKTHSIRKHIWFLIFYKVSELFSVDKDMLNGNSGSWARQVCTNLTASECDTMTKKGN